MKGVYWHGVRLRANHLIIPGGVWAGSSSMAVATDTWSPALGRMPGVV